MSEILIKAAIAELCLGVFEKQFPNATRPRDAIKMGRILSLYVIDDDLNGFNANAREGYEVMNDCIKLAHGLTFNPEYEREAYALLAACSCLQPSAPIIDTIELCVRSLGLSENVLNQIDTILELYGVKK